MTRQIFAGALFAGLAAGLISALLQFAFVTPVLLEGELYETGAKVHFGGPADGAAAVPHEHAPGTPPHDHPPASAPTDAHDEAAPHSHAPAGSDLSRLVTSFFMTLVTFTGFALILAALWALAERGGAAISIRAGLMWGLAGFAAVQLAPALGLAPELPGSSAAPIEARMLWWIGTVAATAAGLALIAFLRPPAGPVAGLLLIAVPHLFGAPHPEVLTGTAPPELSALFASRSLATGAITWAALGLILAWLWLRFGKAQA